MLDIVFSYILIILIITDAGEAAISACHTPISHTDTQRHKEDRGGCGKNLWPASVPTARTELPISDSAISAGCTLP